MTLLQLFVTLFSDRELRTFLRGLSSESLEPFLPSNQAPLRDVAASAIDALVKFKLVDAHLEEALVNTFPAREELIRSTVQASIVAHPVPRDRLPPVVADDLLQALSGLEREAVGLRDLSERLDLWRRATALCDLVPPERPEATRRVQQLRASVVDGHNPASRPSVAVDLRAQAVHVPPHSFRMGNIDPKAPLAERPAQTVRIDAAFWLTSTPVRQEAILAFRSGGDVTEVLRGGALPATQVDWVEAAFFAAWVGGRLPTEVEWEGACRWSLAAQGAPTARVWCRETSHGDLQPVQGDPKRLVDMLGNVWEWCQDDYGPYPARVRRVGAGVPQKVLRGGGFLEPLVRVTATARRGRGLGYKARDVGFRVVFEGVLQERAVAEMGSL